MQISHFKWAMILLIVFSFNIYATETTPIIKDIPITQKQYSIKSNATHKIALYPLHLTQEAKKFLKLKIQSQQLNKSFKNSTTSLPAQIDLGMGDAPVLDQGLHNTCVTFAVTAAINAFLHKGDYVSQLCTLELGNYLSQYGYVESGWDGSEATPVFNKLKMFGIVNKDNEQRGDCAGVTLYDLKNSENHGKIFPLEEYKQLSETISSIYMITIQDEQMFTLDGFPMSSLDEINAKQEAMFQETKKALARGEKVLIGSLINIDIPQAGSAGTFVVPNDTYIVTTKMRNDDEEFSIAGHEMIIHGYDDNAVVADDKGNPQKGLFKVRNSYGPLVGDKGDFYMTYDYFKSLVFGANRIGEISHNSLS